MTLTLQAPFFNSSCAKEAIDMLYNGAFMYITSMYNTTFIRVLWPKKRISRRKTVHGKSHIEAAD